MNGTLLVDIGNDSGNDLVVSPGAVAAVNGSLVVASGSAQMNGSFDVQGPVQMANTLTVAGATEINDTLTVDVDNDSGNELAITSGAAQVAGALGATGATTLGNNLSVAGASTLTGNTEVNGTFTVDVGADAGNDFTVSGGAAQVAGTLGATGATTLANNECRWYFNIDREYHGWRHVGCYPGLLQWLALQPVDWRT